MSPGCNKNCKVSGTPCIFKPISKINHASLKKRIGLWDFKRDFRGKGGKAGKAGSKTFLPQPSGSSALFPHPLSLSSYILSPPNGETAIRLL